MRIRPLQLLAVLVLAGCVRTESAPVPGEPLFASVEDATKVYVDENLHALWNAGDCISVFDRNTGNARYAFEGADGDAHGTFSSEASAGGAALNAIYAVYPYDSGASISSGGVLSVNYPATQHYAGSTFGRGECVMACASSDRSLHFRNAGGCIVLKVYGEGISISSITLKASGGERIAGPATVSIPVGDVPAVSMGQGAGSQITLVCSPAVPLGASESDCTEFWLFLPPVVLAEGISATLNSSDGFSFAQSTSKSIEVKRSTVVRMAPFRFDAGSETVTYTETFDNFANPERGLYKPQSFRPDNSALSSSAIAAQRTAGRTLYYINYYLTDFMESDISQSFLTLMTTNFTRLRTYGAKCVLRFSYKKEATEEAKPWDPTEEWVLRHIEQIKPILQQNADVIYVMQAGFIGVWGEWYYTDHFNFKPSTTEEYQPRKHVLDALLDAMPDNRQVAVRTPTFKMKIYGYGLADTLTRATAHDGSVKSRVAGHNDCFLKSSTDSGTYHDDSERTYWAAESRYLIMGGESCGVSDYCHCAGSGGIPGAIKTLEDYHYSYLNLEYHQGVFDLWGEEGCHDEILRRLGYRLVLREASFPRRPKAGQECNVTLKLQNVGFAAPMNPRDAYLVLTNSSGTEIGRWALGSDPRTWHPESGIISISTDIALPDNASGDCTLWLALPDGAPTLASNPKFSIRLANEGVWNEGKGMNKLTVLSF